MIIVRYAFVQILAYLVDFGGFFLLISLPMIAIGPIVANIISKLLAGMFAFTAHRRFSFKTATKDNRLKQGFRFFSLMAINIQFSSLLLLAMLSIIPIDIIAKICADTSLVLLNFWLTNVFIFKEKDTDRAQ